MKHNWSNLKFEDTIQCYFFSIQKLADLEWVQLCKDLNETVSLLSQGYIWHRDEFKITLPLHNDEEDKDCPEHLISLTCFGDNLEDEWYIVHLLIELTKKYTNLIVKIEDNDGDFILIEAANYLPAWANPENTENRVFIINGNIHIIPPSIVSISSNLKLSEALEIVRLKKKETKASSLIQESILKRVNSAKQLSTDIHKGVVIVPLEIATVLTVKPTLISALVSSFCNADALEAKQYKSIEFNDCVNIEILFTKHLYAMLKHTKLPNFTALKQFEKDNASQIGIKLTCGYKTIMNKLSKDMFTTHEYQQFLNALTRYGFFKGNIEGSDEYNELLEKAKDYFYKIECPLNTSIANQINDIKLSADYEITKKTVKDRSNMCCFEDESDEWLNIRPEQLDEILNKQYSGSVEINNEKPTSTAITNKLSDFLKKSSDFEGIELTRNYDSNNDSNNVEFNSEEFVSCLEKMLNIVSNNGTASDSSDDDNDEDDVDTNNVSLEQDFELATKLKSANKISNDKDILQNLIQSMKEEGLSGPSSTVLKTIGITKNNLLDSDDDDDEDTI